MHPKNLTPGQQAILRLLPEGKYVLEGEEFIRLGPCRDPDGVTLTNYDFAITPRYIRFFGDRSPSGVGFTEVRI